MSNNDMLGPDFEPDKWLRIKTDSAESARRFVGAPPNWPVRFAGFDQRSPGRIWEVLAEGWKSSSD